MDNINFSKIYSVSKLQLFEQCSKAYHFSYLDEVYSKMKAKLRKEPSNIWPFNTLGRAVHDSITLYFYLDKGEQNLENLKDQLKLAWRAEAMARKLPPLGKWGGFKDLEEERKYYKQALQMLINFYKLRKIISTESKTDPLKKIKFLPTKNILQSIEDYKKLIKPLNSDFDVSGKFDLVLELDDKNLSVVDFKTGKSEEKNDFQLKFYKLLAELNFLKPVLKASFYYLKSGRIKEFDLSKEKTEKTKDMVLEKINKIQQEKDFETKPSMLCQYCLFRNFCPAKKEILKYIKEPTQEDFIEDLPF